MTEPNLEAYMHIREARQLLGVSTQTLHNWDKKGQVRTTRLPGGTRLYHKKDIYNILGIEGNTMENRKIIYCRVSSKQESERMNQRIDILRTQYPDHMLITDENPSIEWKRKGIQTLLAHALSNKLEEVVILHPDQLGQFTFEMLEFIFSRTGTRLINMDNLIGKSSDQELAEDILSLVQMHSRKKRLY